MKLISNFFFLECPDLTSIKNNHCNKNAYENIYINIENVTLTSLCALLVHNS